MDGERLFAMPLTKFPVLDQIGSDLESISNVVKVHTDAVTVLKNFRSVLWRDADFRRFSSDLLRLQMDRKSLSHRAREFHVHDLLTESLDEAQQKLPILIMLSKPAILSRHWEKVQSIAGFTLSQKQKRLARLQRYGCRYCAAQGEHHEPLPCGNKESEVRRKIDHVRAEWSFAEFQFENYRQRGPLVLEKKAIRKLIMHLEDSILTLSALVSNRFNAPFKTELYKWVTTLSTVREVVEHWLDVQSTWMYLEVVFSGGDIARSMPLEAKRFSALDKTWVQAVKAAVAQPDVIKVCCEDSTMLTALRHLTEQFEACQKSLAGYLSKSETSFLAFTFSQTLFF